VEAVAISISIIRGGSFSREETFVTPLVASYTPNLQIPRVFNAPTGGGIRRNFTKVFSIGKMGYHMLKNYNDRLC